MDTIHPRTRYPLAYRFVKRFRRTSLQNKNKSIPISHWEQVLRNVNSGNPPTRTAEDDFIPLGEPPSNETIQTIINKMKNGTSPGTDHIETELLKASPPELVEIIKRVLGRVWCTNIVPNRWLETVQVPLPKILKPKSTDDFRRITLSNTIYKIYAAFLLTQTQRYVEEIPHYQAGFLHNRSADDHIFVLRRVTEERWRKGLPTFVLSIDLHKAFDMVDTSQLNVILRSYNVLAYLINRIITAILHERTTIRWNNKRTSVSDRAKGVKQGCPISPYLFVLVLNYVIQRVCRRLQVDENLTDLSLPILLAYADASILSVCQ